MNHLLPSGALPAGPLNSSANVVAACAAGWTDTTAPATSAAAVAARRQVRVQVRIDMRAVLPSAPCRTPDSAGHGAETDPQLRLAAHQCEERPDRAHGFVSRRGGARDLAVCCT